MATLTKWQTKKYFLVICNHYARAAYTLLYVKTQFPLCTIIQAILHNWRQEWSCSTCNVCNIDSFPSAKTPKRRRADRLKCSNSPRANRVSRYFSRAWVIINGQQRRRQSLHNISRSFLRSNDNFAYTL